MKYYILRLTRNYTYDVFKFNVFVITVLVDAWCDYGCLNRLYNLHDI